MQVLKKKILTLGTLANNIKSITRRLAKLEKWYKLTQDQLTTPPHYNLWDRAHDAEADVPCSKLKRDLLIYLQDHLTSSTLTDDEKIRDLGISINKLDHIKKGMVALLGLKEILYLCFISGIEFDITAKPRD